MSFSPFLRIPLTDFTGCFVNHQWGDGPCREMEMKVLDCLEAYGLTRGIKTKCSTLIEDYQECAGRFMQTARMLAMREERLRQYKAGERTKENLYAPPPRTDSF